MTTVRKFAATTAVLVLNGSLLQLAGAQQTDQDPSPFGPAMGTPFAQEPLPAEPEPLLDQRPSAVTTPSQPGDFVADPQVSMPDRARRIHEDQGIQYVSGGVGTDERQAIEALANQFSLRLMFALQDGGQYLADVQVSIREVEGHMTLDARSEGPLFFAQLPPGHYRVEATPSGMPDRIPQSKTVRLTGTGQSRLNFYWK